MGSKLFVDKKLRKKIQKDIKKRNDIETKIEELKKELHAVDADISTDLDEFSLQVDDTTVLSILAHYENSNKKKKQVVREIEKRYKDDSLLIEDTLNLIDWYEKMCDDYNNKI